MNEVDAGTKIQFRLVAEQLWNCKDDTGRSKQSQLNCGSLYEKMRYTNYKNIIRLLIFLIAGVVIFLLVNQWIYIREALHGKEIELLQKTPFFQQNSKRVLKDWHDAEAMARDAARSGLGEHGKPAYITNLSKRKLERELRKKNGFNALLSDMISVNRSLPDIRDQG